MRLVVYRLVKKEKEPWKWNARNDMKADGHVIYNYFAKMNES
ncbi:hypothetical protein SPE26_32200 [Bacillus thuringiensis]|uniref:Transposase n=1 Tax=Bacillus thuringiensis TaxID=1428 RepID=A0AAW9GVK9_BACTU|nr:hypothetical protein [Bacillus thuringiensis]MDY0855472.1 hypothetical protein [Bacillus thuringiensis]MDY4395281.1 hypothetical protein [Bacillus thuringiensis]